MEKIVSMTSGYLGIEESGCYIGSEMRNVEILHLTSTNVIARGQRYGRQWFLKGLRKELRDATAMRRQLLKEFEIHSRLRHPSVVQAVGLEEIEGIGVCIVQEWIEGITLGEALQKGQLSGGERKKILRQLCEAVSYLHSRGVVHRDLKPANVMIRSIGKEPVLVDFGLADSSDYLEWKQPAGTPGYVSPEQLDAGGADPADDVYSLGVMMRELTPALKRLSAKCTDSIGRRPKDAGVLLKILGRRERRPKVVWSLLAAVAATALIIFSLSRMDTLGKSAGASELRVAELTEKNVRNEALVSSLQDSLENVSSLRDSLVNVRSQLALTEHQLNQIAEYESLRQRLYKAGCEEIDRILREADRKEFSKLAPGNILEYNEKIIKLTREMTETVEKLGASVADSDLRPEDKEKIKMDFYNYNAVRLPEYQQKWLKKINVAG
ncbi:MAG: serine/threonine protein kinase [Bacteroidales bacterium]|nr:serine/threonine protein kinase [Bacteroidales bacterium]